MKEPAESILAVHTEPTLPFGLDMVGLHDDAEGLRVILDGRRHRLPIYRVRFPNRLAYRWLDESKRLRGLEMVGNGVPGALCEFVGSAWLRWFHEENRGFYEDSPLRHWALFTENDWIDVLSVTTPVVDDLFTSATPSR